MPYTEEWFWMGHGRGESAVVLDRALPFVSFRGTDLYRARGLATDYS